MSRTAAQDDSQDLLDRFVVPQREEEFDRALAHIARAPRRARVLFQAAWHGQMDHRVVREPWQGRVDCRRFGGVTDDP